MIDQPELFRVQTTDGKSTVVWRSSDHYYIGCTGWSIWFAGGKNVDTDCPDLNLDTLEPLHLLTDDELQARDDALLDILAVSLADFHCGGVGAIGIINSLRKDPTHER